MVTTDAAARKTVKLELTELESTLRRLLLDVAYYINPESPSELRFTGGWVRDKLLGVGSHDIDVAINDMTGYQFGLKMKDYLEVPGNSDKYGLDGVATTDANAKSQSAQNKTVVVSGLHKIEANPEKSKHLETVTTRIFGLDIDLVNLRKETYTEESRNPQMEFGTPEEDALRRDATINAMFYNLQTEVVEDFTGRGHDDMSQRTIRTPLEPYQTFKDDPLRVLRLIRFASRLDYEIEEDARKAMGEQSIQEALKVKISRERVGVELEKMLKGPDPRRALALIDELRLYDTIFTDPTSNTGFSPEHALWRPSYTCLFDILSGVYPSVIKKMLLPDHDHEYTAWMLANFTAWIDAPTPQPAKPGGKMPPHIAVNAAREGIKAPNKISDVLNLAIRDTNEILSLKNGFASSQRTGASTATADCATRDTLGMAIRRWGSTWRSQAVFTLMLEVARSTKDPHDIMREWSSWLTHLEKIDVLNACDFRPVVDGKALSKALGLKPGPWMKEALDVVMAWQLRQTTPPTVEAAIEEVRNKQGELTAVLIRHFLTLTIRPLFAKKQTRNVTAQGRKVMSQPVLPGRFVGAEEEEEASRLWKSDAFVVDILRWIVTNLDSKLLEEFWPLLLPPILALLDDMEVKYKAVGCTLLSSLLATTPPSLLARTGLGPVFDDAITPCLSYLPTLTPEAESTLLLDAAYPALFTLTAVRFSPVTTASVQAHPPHTPSPYAQQLSNILHTQILPSIDRMLESHPTIVVTLLAHLSTLIGHLRTDTIAHLGTIVPMLTEILSMPFIAAHPPLPLAATRTLQVLLANAWPRIWRWRGDVLGGLCAAWVRVSQESAGRGGSGTRTTTWKVIEQTMACKTEMRVAVNMLVAAVDAVVVDGIVDGQTVNIRAELEKMAQADPSMEELLHVREE